MIESMAHGTPVVIVDVCSATETLEATGSGLVRHDGDLTGMLDDVEELIHDGERLRLMGQIGERVARERFSGEASLSRHLDMYRSVLIDSPNKLRVRHRH
jgi:glycosyltransferase involved in cell wall biosynthesis